MLTGELGMDELWTGDVYVDAFDKGVDGDFGGQVCGVEQHIEDR